MQVDATGAIRGLQGSKSVLLAADRALEQGRALVHREMVRLAPKAEGTLHHFIHQGRIAPLLHQVRSDARHAAWVERGTGRQGPRRAGGNRMLSVAGVSNIALWIQRRGITPRAPDVTPEQLPWLIARKIAVQGTRPQPYAEPAGQSQEPQVLRLVRAAVERELAAQETA